MRSLTLALCAGLFATPTFAAPVDWHTDYFEAYRRAQQEESLLLISFCDGERFYAPQPEVVGALEPFVLLKVPVTAAITVDGETKSLIGHKCFQSLDDGPGLAVVNLKYRGKKYGRVRATLDFQQAQSSGIRVLQFIENVQRQLGVDVLRDEFDLAWHTDYATAHTEARRAKKLLFLAFDSDEHRFSPNAQTASRLRDFVLARLRVEQSQKLLGNVGLRQFHCDSGIGVIDLKNEGSNYGRLTHVLPSVYVTREGTAAMLKLAGGETDLAELTWLADYHEARAEAERQNKMLLIAIDSEEETFSPKLKSIPILHGYVRLRQKTDTRYMHDGEPKPLIRFADFKSLREKPGLVVYDFRSKGDSHYGTVVGVMPYKYVGPNPGNRVFGETERQREFLALEPNTLSRRTLTWAIRVSKGHGNNTRLRSADGRPSAKLMSWALKNSRLQCRFGCGHHAGGPMRSEIASPGPGDDIVDGALNMVRIWRSSPPHYGSMARFYPRFGYDMSANSRTHWYGTGRF